MADTMRALRVEEHGDLSHLVFRDIPVPVPGPGEVRLQVAAAGINHLDLWVRRGVPGHRFPLPITPGCDAAGVVEALGPGVGGWSVGDAAVVAPGLSCGACPACIRGEDHLCPGYGIVGETRDGSDATFLVVPARNLISKPQRLNFPQAASYALTFLTAWNMLVRRADVRPGEIVLVHAAGSGVSSAGIQIARLLGARVAATASAPEKLEAAMRLGAETTINYRDEDFVQVIRDCYGRAGVNVVFDHVGTDTFGPSLRCLARGGRYVFCGATSGFAMEADFRPMFFKNISILGSTMGRLGDLHRITDLVTEGRLEPQVARVYPLADAARAHADLEARRLFGKAVLQVAPPEST